MKKATLFLIINMISQNGLAEKRPDFGKIAIDGMVSGMEMGIKSIPKAIGIMSNKISESNKTVKWKKTVQCNSEGKKCKTIYSD